MNYYVVNSVHVDMEWLETGWLNATKGRMYTSLQWRKSLPQSHFKISFCWRGEQSRENQNAVTNSQPHDFWSSSSPKHLRTSLSANGIMKWLDPSTEQPSSVVARSRCLRRWKCVNMWWILDFCSKNFEMVSSRVSKSFISKISKLRSHRWKNELYR